ncbi:MAG: DUF177 domain-containing protein [Armatimonadetes bacterium]|nr:DUF177 domain-containing protein [Armatimonadota bacterium]
MKYDITELLLHPGRRIKIDVREDDLRNLDPNIAAPITGQLTFQNAVEAFLVTGKVKTALRLDCARCLEPFALPVEVEVDEQFPIHLIQPQKGGKPVPAPKEAVPEDDWDEDLMDLADNILDGPLFDVGELLRQLVLLEAPLQPLCQESCRGLCPFCGCNFNNGQCECKGGNHPPTPPLC